MADEEEKREQEHHHLEGDHFIIDPPKPPKSQAEIDSERRERNTEKFQTNQIATNNRLVLLNLFLVLFTTAGIYISIWQAKIAQRSSVAAERGSEAAQQSSETSDKAVLLAQKSERDSRKSSEDQARQSAKALDASIDNFRQEQRAWISVTNVNVTAEVGKPLNVNVGFVNSGKTPARDIDGIAVLDPVAKESEPNFDYSNVSHLRIGYFSPGLPDHFPLIGTRSKSTGEIRPLTEQLHNQIEQGTVLIYAHGIIRYTDAFNVKHWIKFCYFADTVHDSVALCKDSKRNDSDKKPD